VHPLETTIALSNGTIAGWGPPFQSSVELSPQKPD